MNLSDDEMRWDPEYKYEPGVFSARGLRELRAQVLEYLYGMSHGQIGNARKQARMELWRKFTEDWCGGSQLLSIADAELRSYNPAKAAFKRAEYEAREERRSRKERQYVSSTLASGLEGYNPVAAPMELSKIKEQEAVFRKAWIPGQRVESKEATGKWLEETVSEGLKNRQRAQTYREANVRESLEREQQPEYEDLPSGVTITPMWIDEPKERDFLRKLPNPEDKSHTSVWRDWPVESRELEQGIKAYYTYGHTYDEEGKAVRPIYEVPEAGLIGHVTDRILEEAGQVITMVSVEYIGPGMTRERREPYPEKYGDDLFILALGKAATYVLHEHTVEPGLYGGEQTSTKRTEIRLAGRSMLHIRGKRARMGWSIETMEGGYEAINRGKVPSILAGHTAVILTYERDPAFEAFEAPTRILQSESVSDAGTFKLTHTLAGKKGPGAGYGETAKRMKYLLEYREKKREEARERMSVGARKDPTPAEAMELKRKQLAAAARAREAREQMGVPGKLKTLKEAMKEETHDSFWTGGEHDPQTHEESATAPRKIQIVEKIQIQASFAGDQESEAEHAPMELDEPVKTEATGEPEEKKKRPSMLVPTQHPQAKSNAPQPGQGPASAPSGNQAAAGAGGNQSGSDGESRKGKKGSSSSSRSSRKSSTSSSSSSSKGGSKTSKASKTSKRSRSKIVARSPSPPIKKEKVETIVKDERTPLDSDEDVRDMARDAKYRKVYASTVNTRESLGEDPAGRQTPWDAEEMSEAKIFGKIYMVEKKGKRLEENWMEGWYEEAKRASAIAQTAAVKKTPQVPTRTFGVAKPAPGLPILKGECEHYETLQEVVGAYGGIIMYHPPDAVKHAAQAEEA
jgi:hypothetical protein